MPRTLKCLYYYQCILYSEIYLALFCSPKESKISQVNFVNYYSYDIQNDTRFLILIKNVFHKNKCYLPSLNSQLTFICLELATTIFYFFLTISSDQFSITLLSLQKPISVINKFFFIIEMKTQQHNICKIPQFPCRGKNIEQHTIEKLLK